jgi:hypothetical protein
LAVIYCSDKKGSFARLQLVGQYCSFLKKEPKTVALRGFNSLANIVLICPTMNIVTCGAECKLKDLGAFWFHASKQLVVLYTLLGQKEANSVVLCFAEYPRGTRSAKE